MAIPIIKNNVTFSPYRFYNDFLYDAAEYYSGNLKIPIEFRLIDGDDIEVYGKKYTIDPITIPLLLSVAEQFGKFHKSAIKLHLFNNPATINLLEFLYKGEFFKISGPKEKKPLGRNIFEFNDAYLGGFEGKKYKSDHKVRAFSLNDTIRYNPELTIKSVLSNIKSDDNKRDFLIEEISYKADEYFHDLLYDNNNDFTSNQTNLFIGILAELISNGILHGDSDVYAMMFANKFGTKFSISDNGCGIGLQNKKDPIYKYKEVFNILKNVQMPFSLPNAIQINLLMIFEMLYYSMIKKREGLFDLMSNVVLGGNGYFRLHTERVQIIISRRMNYYLKQLSEIRLQIRQNYPINNNVEIQKLKKQAQSIFKCFYIDIINKHNEDVQYSSVRFYNVKFKGVHIEVEIPNFNAL